MKARAVTPCEVMSVPSTSQSTAVTGSAERDPDRADRDDSSGFMDDVASLLREVGWSSTNEPQLHLFGVGVID